MSRILVINPATEEVIAELPQASQEEIRATIDKAYEAFIKWSETPLRERAKLLLKAAEMIERGQEELVKLLVSESGKPIRDAKVEIIRTITIIRASAEEAKFVLEGSVPRVDAYDYPLGNDRRLATIVREPIGVIGGAQSYNNPASTFAHKVAPVVVAGNTVIIKPSSYTPLTALKMAEYFKKAGFPEGVVNVVVGSGEEVFNELIENPKVAGISFTGSTAVGLQVAAKAAGRGKKFMIAPSGSDPAIIFEDADLEEAAAIITRARFENAGQNCNATKRAYVHRKVYDAFLDLLVRRTAAIKVGDPMDETVDMGPLISDKMVKAMERFVADAVSKGGRVLFGGRRMQRRGYFFEPTVIAFDQNVEALALKEEVFGPVLPVVPFESEEEAVALANSTQYGLQAAVYTRDYKRAFRVARAIKAGAVMINDSTRVRFDALPYGGVKMSGFGWREGVRSTMYYFTEPKFYVLGL
ncbi:aldehyde dehydrogenase family protein [Pyrobaculum aerophilum]|uniref:Aldehyde dehydrogenase n=1 Tax=Pyrobaculum aerophilum TaxID=13773 RepID=A0A371R4P4_9CREN|nr:aldehyde dehydrogenase family protein [Pyrobaculum aerophilum]RFA93896.1 aldehyde dehydrogenase [Pyrobaculum aerophilum]RFA99046.1 aldehyde dehydrogenase [Pyrobaculum aerophilum]